MFAVTFNLREFKSAEVLFYLIALFFPWKKYTAKSLYSHASSYKHHEKLLNLRQFFYYYYFKPFREEKELSLSLALLTPGKEFGQMFVFHQEEEAMNLIKITNTIYKLHLEEGW